MVTEVKPWEPVMFGWASFDSFYWGLRLSKENVMDDVTLVPEGMKVTLANSQRVIVRALSEERKAARRKAKMIAAASDSYLGDMQ